jgi:mRNA interferase MazF
MRRGDVVLIADRAAGDYAGKPRPAVVIQSGLFDATDSVIVAPLTTVAVDAPLLRIAVQPSAALPLTAQSWVMVEKLTAVRRDRAREVIGRLPPETMLTLERSLAVVLGLG